MPAAAYTRWLTRGKCVKFVHDHKKEIIDILDELADTAGDSTTRYEAMGLSRQIKTHQNMFLLNVFHNIFHSINILSKMLQDDVIDAAKANSKLRDFREHLDDMRSETSFSDMMSQLDILETEIPFTEQPRKRQRNEQTLRDSGYTPSDSDVHLSQKQQLKQSLVAIIDAVSTEFDARFDNLDSFAWMKMLDPKQFDQLGGRDNVDKVRECIANLKKANHFIDADSGAILAQFQTLYRDSDLRKELENVKVIPSLLQKLYELDLVDALPLVTTICDLASSTAITSVACERSFSVLRRIKNYQRNKMGQDRTKHLMVLSVESELTHKLAQDCSFSDKIIDRFAK